MIKSESKLRSLTRTPLLARNTLYNLLGQIAPLIAAILAIPVLIHSLGAERFGVLAIVWVVLGYFGLFDLGLGRALTKMIAERLGAEADEEIGPIIWTGLGFMLLLGILMLGLLVALTPLFVQSLLKIPDALVGESYLAFLFLAACVPVVILTSGLRAILEAHQFFGAINIIRAISGVLLYAAPLLVLPFSRSIHHVVLMLILVRLVVALLHAYVCWRKITPMQTKPGLRRHLVKPMFKLGGWISVSNIIGPIMVYFDRFLMGVWLSVTAVAYYVTPYEVISKALVISGSVVGVLFPAFSMSISAEPGTAADLYSRGNRVLLMLFFPFTLIVVTFAHSSMSLWLGKEFADHGARVLQWLAIGVMINAPGQVAFAAIQAAGRPDLTAKLHLIEMPFYLLALYFFVQGFGITGAAMAWTLRMAVDTGILLFMAEKCVGAGIPQNVPFKIILGGTTAFLCFISLVSLPHAKMFLSLAFGVLLLPFFWRFLVLQTEKNMLTKNLRRSTRTAA